MTRAHALLKSIRVKNGAKQRVRWLIPLHIMMVELVGGVDAKFKWDISAEIISSGSPAAHDFGRGC